VSGGEALEAFYSALLEDDAEALYERAPCGYLSTTPDGTIVKVNQTFLTLTGYERGDLIGQRTFSDLLTAGGRIYHETHYAPMLRLQDSVREIALDIVRADGGRIPMLVNSVLECNADGAPVVVRTALFNATERREYERELLRAKKRAEESEGHASLVARTLQQTLIPPEPPKVPGLDVAAVYRPAGSGDEIGGDFYDMFEAAHDDWIMAVGDVCGKGVDAAIITAAVRYAIRAAAVRRRQPSEILDAVNEVLLRHETDRFCTVALMRLRHMDGKWTATISLAGHPFPLLVERGCEVTAVGRPGSLVGVFESPTFWDLDVALGPGDAIVLYTDGVTEGRRDDEFYGEARLFDVVTRATSAGTIVDRVLEDVLAFQSGEARDDIVVVAAGVPTS
jgi:sigma-B regulation protein RsbU (phosphoserine phosphatase)